MKQITSINNDLIKKYFLLKNKKYILKNKQFLIEGKNIIEEAIKNKIVSFIFITKQEQFPLFNNKILVNKEIIKKLSQNISNDYGAIAICDIKEEYLEISNLNKIIVLENVNNPGNLGSIIRSARAFGFEAVVLIGTQNTFKFNHKVINSSQGTIFNFPVFNSTLKEISSYFFPFFFTLDKGNNLLQNINKIEKEKYALVFGNEAKGIEIKTIENWKGEKIKINIKQNVESLNLSNSASIAMFHFSKIK